MLGNRDIIEYIEKYRLLKKMSIKGLTQGITSTRNYSRYLSKAAEISFEIYSQFLDRLEVPVFEFSCYSNNVDIIENIDELNFTESIIEGYFENAHEIMFPLIKDKEPKSFYCIKSAPIAIKWMEYHFHKITIHELFAFSRNILNLEETIKRTIITMDDVNSIYLFAQFCSEAEKRKISEFLMKFIVKKKIKLFSSFVEGSVSRLHLLSIQLLTNFEEMSAEDHENVRIVASIVLEYISRAKFMNTDVKIFQYLYEYNQKYHLQNQEIVFQYILSCLSSPDENLMNERLNKLSEEDKNIFFQMLNNSDYLSQPMYGGLVKHESI